MAEKTLVEEQITLDDEDINTDDDMTDVDDESPDEEEDLGDLTETDDDDDSMMNEDTSKSSGNFTEQNITFYDSDEDEEEEELDKFNSNDITVDLLSEHPEYKSHNIKEVNALCNVIRDSSGMIIDELHRTIPFITRYEKAKIIGERSKQLSYSNVEPMIDVPPDVIDSYDIAVMEYNANAIPFIVKRNLPDGSCEYWKFKDLEKIIFN